MAHYIYTERTSQTSILYLAQDKLLKQCSKGAAFPEQCFRINSRELAVKIDHTPLANKCKQQRKKHKRRCPGQRYLEGRCSVTSRIILHSLLRFIQEMGKHSQVEIQST